MRFILWGGGRSLVQGDSWLLTECVPPQPIPNRREERPVSCFVPGSAPLQPNLASLARDAATVARDKQRPQVPSMMISNETYGTMMDLNLPPPGPTPPLPPRGPHRGQCRRGLCGQRSQMLTSDIILLFLSHDVFDDRSAVYVLLVIMSFCFGIFTFLHFSCFCVVFKVRVYCIHSHQSVLHLRSLLCCIQC